MKFRIEENRWLTEAEYNNYSSDGKHQVTVVRTDEQINQLYYYVNMVYYLSHSYEELVSCLVREKYDLNAELAILRQRDTKVEDFNTYNTYAEQCKVDAQSMIKEREDFYASLQPQPEPLPVDPVA